MNYPDWRLEGFEFVNCNCNFGCPCQFNSPPTTGDCKALGAVRIDKGHFGETSLDGLAFAMTLKWPGAIHEGNGEAQAFIDERATEAQREAILAILSGETSEPGATFFNVFASTMTTMHEPVFCRISITGDVDARRASVSVGDIIDAEGEPIINPVTGQEHRARIDLPQGFEYAVAEVASGRTSARGAMPLELTGSHSHVTQLDIGPRGVYR